ncbi:MAG: cell envelope integrity protein CreD [Bacteroidetes bacterium]|nr:cell envelope integrity protein CreD [Bacteroidota bacterium]
METIEQTEKNFTHSITFKLLIVAPLVLLFLIPQLLLTSLVKEREQRKNEVVMDVSQKWGSAQTITGPVLVVPFRKKDVEEDKYVLDYAYFLPNFLDIKGEVEAEIRYRGIFKVPVYNSKMSFNGMFPAPDLGRWKIRDEDILWDNAFAAIGITDLSGIQNSIAIRWNDTLQEVSPGIVARDIAYTGVNATVNVSEDTTYTFSFELNLNGTGTLHFIPVGKETNVDISSPWINPSFDGNFLPDNRKITEQGFTANWNILDVNRYFPQHWTGQRSFDLQSSAFGVSLYLPVDHYQQSMRSVKYALMFISLTFIVFLFVEALNKRRIHFIVYVLVGFALIIFYSLLLSLSEQIGFNLAYLVAGIAVIGMITLYSHSSFRNIKLTLLLCFILMVLYTFLFTLLQLQDFALLMGSIGLFIVLAVIMALSRKVNWYF